jgi:hypothetical protein
MPRRVAATGLDSYSVDWAMLPELKPTRASREEVDQGCPSALANRTIRAAS